MIGFGFIGTLAVLVLNEGFEETVQVDASISPKRLQTCSQLECSSCSENLERILQVEYVEFGVLYVSMYMSAVGLSGDEVFPKCEAFLHGLFDAWERVTKRNLSSSAL